MLLVFMISVENMVSEAFAVFALLATDRTSALVGSQIIVVLVFVAHGPTLGISLHPLKEILRQNGGKRNQ